MSGTLLLSLQHISKSFPGVKVLNDVNIDFKRGTVHSIVGENGAGKSTLMNIIFGVYQDYDGNMLWDGKKVEFASPIDAQKQGIAMVHQENSLIPYLSIMDNIYLGHYPKKGMFIDKKTLRNQVIDLMQELKINTISPDTKVIDLSAAQKQLVEITKALSMNAQLLLLDEPTASLTDKETENLKNIIEILRKKEVSVVYVSHKLEEVFAISDEISVLRDGCMIANIPSEKFDYDEVVFHMIGRKLEKYTKSEKDNRDLEHSDVILEVDHLSRRDDFTDVSFTARKGEILGFGGLVGAGRSELFEAIFGYDNSTSGEIRIDGKNAKIRHPKDAIKYGMALVPEERKVKGIFACLSVMDNINIATFKDLKDKGLISRKKEYASAENYVDKLKIVTPTVKSLISQLSGGNQQKAIISRWLRTNPRVLCLDEPTHGIDIGTKEDIYRIINDLAYSGITILLISSEMPELIRLSDRIVVMHEGKLQHILEHDEISQENIMKYAMGYKA